LKGLLAAPGVFACRAPKRIKLGYVATTSISVTTGKLDLHFRVAEGSRKTGLGGHSKDWMSSVRRSDGWPYQN